MAGGNTKLQTLLGLFRGSGGNVALQRSGLDYWLHYPIAGELVASFYLDSYTIGAYTANSILAVWAKKLYASVEEDDASVVRTGTWVNLTNAGAYGGDYSYSLTAGDTAVFTTPAGVTAVGVRGCHLTNCGVAKVAIDGDLTRANKLSTAQQLVDAGTLANTVLIANGGTLNPTDRIINMYGANNYDTKTIFADDLTAGAHVITLTITGYKQAASSAARVYIAGMLYHAPSTGFDAIGLAIMDVIQIGAGGSVYDYVNLILPDGAVTPAYVGSGHGYENQTSLTFTLDGVASAPADGEVVYGNSIIATRVTDLYHPEIGAGGTPIGASVTTYTIDARYGLKIDAAITWGQGGATTQSYPAMFPVLAFLDRGANIDLRGQSVTLADNNGSFKANAKSKAAYLWDDDGNYGALLYAPDTSKNTLDYVYAPTVSMAIEDRAGGVFNKIYQARVSGATETFVLNDVWQSTAYYYIQYFANTSIFPL